MNRISFNKGKDFYRVDERAPLEDVDFVIDKLNLKRWGNVVDKFNVVVDSLSNGSKNGLYCPVPKDDTMSEEYNKKVNRFNILRTYLHYVGGDIIL